MPTAADTLVTSGMPPTLALAVGAAVSSSGGGGAITGVTVGSPGSATANTAAINAALAAGGNVQLPAGTIYINGTLIIPTQCHIAGKGCAAYSDISGANMTIAAANQAASGNIAGTIIRWDTPTGVMMDVQAGGVVLEDFHLSNQYQLGALTAGGPIQLSKADGTNINRVSTWGGYIGINVIQATLLMITNSKILSPWYVGIQLNDTLGPNPQYGGDWGISNCMIVADNAYTTNPGFVAPQAGIKQIGGGGLRVVGNKFNSYNLTNGFRYGYWCQPGAGGQDWASVCASNSFEGCATAGAFYDGTNMTTSTQLGNFVQNEFGAVSGTGSMVVITGNSGNSSLWVNGVINDNFCIGMAPASPAVLINVFAANITIGTLQYQSNAPNNANVGPIISLNPSTTAIHGISGISYDITKINVSNPGTTWTMYVQDFTAGIADKHTQGAAVKVINRELSNPLTATVNSGTAQNFAFITMTNNGQFGVTAAQSLYVKLRISGYIYNNTDASGAFGVTAVFERAINITTAGVGTPVLIGTDYCTQYGTTPANIVSFQITYAGNIATLAWKIESAAFNNVTKSCTFNGDLVCEILGAATQIARYF